MLKQFVGVMYVVIDCDDQYADRKDNDNNNEGAVLEQDHIWEQSKAGTVQHGQQQVRHHTMITINIFYCKQSDGTSS